MKYVICMYYRIEGPLEGFSIDTQYLGAILYGQNVLHMSTLRFYMAKLSYSIYCKFVLVTNVF